MPFFIPTIEGDTTTKSSECSACKDLSTLATAAVASQPLLSNTATIVFMFKRPSCLVLSCYCFGKTLIFNPYILLSRDNELPILPIDTGRYGTNEIRRIFEEEMRVQKMLDVEA